MDMSTVNLLTFKTKNKLNMNDFHLYAVEAKEDTLVTKLRQTKGLMMLIRQEVL